MDFIDKLTVQEAFDDEKDGEKLWVDTWLNNGVFAPSNQKVKMDDMLATPNARYWLPKVMEEIVREPVEPILMIERLLDRVQYSGAATITFPAIGAIVADDIPEAGPYPERTLQIGPGSITVDVGKSGVAVKITEEMRRYSRFDVLALHVRAARRALDRHKEKKGFDFVNSMGTVLFDNISPTTSAYGTCTGRSLTGTGNGSCTMEDLLKAYSFIMMQGYRPDTILLHPLTWSMWMADPLLRTIVKNTGNGAWFQPHTMGMSTRPWAAASQGGKGQASGLSYTPSGNAAGDTPSSLTQLDPQMQGAPQIPSYFPYPLTVLVSPFVPFDVSNNTADIMIFDSSNLGALVEDESVATDQWDDPAYDITKIKLRERYGFAIYEDGLAIGVLKNIPVKANEIALPVHPTISAAGSLDELDVTVAIDGL